MKRRYRILERNGYYYPQVRYWFWPFWLFMKDRRPPVTVWSSTRLDAARDKAKDHKTRTLRGYRILEYSDL